MSSKTDKFKSLMKSPSGSVETKEEMIGSVTTANSQAFVPIAGKKKATFELDAELHHWLKLHCVQNNQKMVDLVETLLRKYKADQESGL